MSNWRDIQRLDKVAKRGLPESNAQVVGVDKTWVKVKNDARPLGVVAEVGEMC